MKKMVSSSNKTVIFWYFVISMSTMLFIISSWWIKTIIFNDSYPDWGEWGSTIALVGFIYANTLIHSCGTREKRWYWWQHLLFTIVTEAVFLEGIVLVQPWYKQWTDGYSFYLTGSRGTEPFTIGLLLILTVLWAKITFRVYHFYDTNHQR